MSLEQTQLFTNFPSEPISHKNLYIEVATMEIMKVRRGGDRSRNEETAPSLKCITNDIALTSRK